MAVQQKKKKNIWIISLVVIISLVIVGSIVFFSIRSNSASQTKSDNKNQLPPRPNADNSQEDSGPTWYRKMKDNISKIKNDDKTFYYTFAPEIWEGSWGNLGNSVKKVWRKFEKIRNGVRYELLIIANHPSLNNIIFPNREVEDKTGRYYQIEGLNFADFTRKEMRDGPYFEKQINLTGQITVTPISSP